MTENTTTPTYSVGDRVRTTVHVPGDTSGDDIPTRSLGVITAVYPDQFGFGQKVDVRLDGIPIPVCYYANEIEIAPQETAALVNRSTPRRFTLVRNHGVTGAGPIADGVQWPDGTITIRWRSARPSTVHWRLNRSTPRRFTLVRNHGVTGAGPVADGVQWPDGTVTIRWRSARPSTVDWRSISDAEAVHGGHTRIVWVDADPTEFDDEETEQ